MALSLKGILFDEQYTDGDGNLRQGDLIFDKKYGIWVPDTGYINDLRTPGSPYEMVLNKIKEYEGYNAARGDSAYDSQIKSLYSQLASANPGTGYLDQSGVWSPGTSQSGQTGVGGAPITNQGIYDQAYKDAGSGQAELDALTKQYGSLADDLTKFYGDTAKAAGTYSGTGEFDAGLKSQVAQGYSGAEFALRNRINAINRILGKEEIGQSKYDAKTGTLSQLPFMPQASQPTTSAGTPIAPAPTHDVGGNAVEEQPIQQAPVTNFGTGVEPITASSTQTKDPVTSTLTNSTIQNRLGSLSKKLTTWGR